MTQPADIETEGVDEIQRARLEDPDFPTVRARAIARAKGERYNPAIHGPFEETPAEKERKSVGEKMERKGSLQSVDTDGLLGRFMKRGPEQPTLTGLDEAEKRRKDLHG